MKLSEVTAQTPVAQDRIVAVVFLSIVVVTGIAGLVLLPQDRSMLVGIIVAVLIALLGLPAGKALAGHQRRHHRTGSALIGGFLLFIGSALVLLLVSHSINERVDLGVDLRIIVVWAEIGVLCYVGLMYLVASRRPG